MKKEYIERRAFLKTGMGITAAGVVSLSELFVSPGNSVGSNPRISDPLQRDITDIIQKYGGEFGGIKPGSGRKNNGNI